VGGRERSYSYSDANSRLRGISFVLPDTGIPELPVVYLEEDGAWRRARPSEAAVSARLGLVELSVRPKARVSVTYPHAYSLGAYDRPGTYLGDVADFFGADAVAVRSVPSELDIGEVEPTLSEIAGELAQGGSDPTRRRDTIFASVACKAAIKAGRASDEREMSALAARVLSGEIKYCPHGRPVMMELTKTVLDRGFKRIT
jgi:hypothetical protein